ncbi:unnamed protein product [Pseudo-nitzschia multistriata]|uniref:Uncharacterized protein n=1 Tax=Pseudo-nitzschia multistriata TaxID=183589 RepID=A0A448ZLR9_9STRA|nr:unnamed protein product [Pseudo-nitzschia multistriata]
MEGIDLGANQSVTLHLAGRGNRNRLVKWRCNYGPVRNNQVNTFERDVRKQIAKELKEWGIDPKKSKDHEDFWREVSNQAVAATKHSSSCAISIETLFTNTIALSREVAEAVRQVLRNELEDSVEFTFTNASDLLEFDFKPFYFVFDKSSRSNVLQRRFELKKYKLKELDPFHRFEGIEHSAEDWFRKIWKTTSLGGYVFEALVAHHMVHHMQCKSCKCPQFKERYLVIVSRKETYVKKLEMVHRVSLARIRNVEPRLCGESFVGRGSHIRIISNINIEKGSLEKAWCYVKPIADYTAMAKEVFNNFYGDGAWTKENSKEIENNEHESPSKSRLEIATPNEEEKVEQLRENLKQELRVSSDDDEDWESLY